MGLFDGGIVSVQGAPAATPSFGLVQTPFGTSPTADAPGGTLTLTSTDLTVTITGNSTTDTIDFSVNESSVVHNSLYGLQGGGGGDYFHLSSASLSYLNYLQTLTDGSVLFGNGGSVSEDNANFFWDYSNKRLGLLRTDPSYTLDIYQGTARVEAGVTLTVSPSFDSPSIVPDGSTYLTGDTLGYRFYTYKVINGTTYISEALYTSDPFWTVTADGDYAQISWNLTGTNADGVFVEKSYNSGGYSEYQQVAGTTFIDDGYNWVGGTVTPNPFPLQSTFLGYNDGSTFWSGYFLGKTYAARSVVGADEANYNHRVFINETTPGYSALYVKSYSDGGYGTYGAIEWVGAAGHKLGILGGDNSSGTYGDFSLFGDSTLNGGRMAEFNVMDRSVGGDQRRFTQTMDFDGTNYHVDYVMGGWYRFSVYDNGRVGVNTNTPDAGLHVRSDYAPAQWGGYNVGTKLDNTADYVATSNFVWIPAENSFGNQAGILMTSPGGFGYIYGLEPSANYLRLAFLGTSDGTGITNALADGSYGLTMVYDGFLGLCCLDPIGPLDVRQQYADQTNTSNFLMARFRTYEASTPNDLKIWYVGDVTSANRRMILQTGEHNIANNGILNFQYYGGTVAVGNVTGTTAWLEIEANTTSYASLKFNSGNLKTSPTIGGVEFLTDKLYLTINTGSARKEFTLNDIALTSGRMPFITTNGRLTDDSSLTYSTSTGLTITDKNIVLGTTTGTKIGTATTQKLGFYNATPIVQPSSTTDLRTALINLGLYATGGASPLDLNGGAFTTSGVGTFSGTTDSTSNTTGIVKVSGGLGVVKSIFAGGDIACDVAGKGFKVKEGSNAKMGTATLVAGTVTVSTTAVTASSRIFLTIQTNGGTVGVPYVSARVASTSFTITSTSGTDTSTLAWIMFEVS
jgi:hypothetical protein